MPDALIPVGERGEFRITDEMLGRVTLSDIEAFEIALFEEARTRGLHVEVWQEKPGYDYVVRWRPDHT